MKFQRVFKRKKETTFLVSFWKSNEIYETNSFEHVPSELEPSSAVWLGTTSQCTKPTLPPLSQRTGEGTGVRMCSLTRPRNFGVGVSTPQLSIDRQMFSCKLWNTVTRLYDMQYVCRTSHFVKSVQRELKDNGGERYHDSFLSNCYGWPTSGGRRTLDPNNLKCVHWSHLSYRTLR